MSYRYKPMMALLLALLLLLCAMPSAAMEQNDCITSAEAAAQLLENHDERLRSQAITSTGWLLEIYRSAAGTWTQVIYQPQGGCVYLTISGTDWLDVESEAGQAS